jgi:probable HAF family extracellular repeat protein
MILKRLWFAVLFAGLLAGMSPTRADGQESPLQQQPQHHHYKLVDMGALGGPQSIVFELNTRNLNNQGTFAACADTPNLDPNNPQTPYFGYPDFQIDPYIQHVFNWKKGKVTDLGALPGGGSSCMQWISEEGWIAGGSANGLIDPLTGYPELNATLWKNGQIINLGTLGGNESLAWSLNDKGQVAGYALNATPDPFAGAVFANGATQARAFLWQNGNIRDLGTLGGPDSDALLVNNAGQVAGLATTGWTINSTTQSPTVDPFLWENGKMIDLGTLGGTYGYPNALNSRGQVVGDSNVAGDQNFDFHAFLWEHGAIKDLGTLGGTRSEPRWINEAGEVAGWALLPGNQVVHATLWKNGKIVDLGVLPGSPCSYANGVDALGQVLGAVQQCPDMGPRIAFLWENGDMVDLNVLLLPGSDLHLIGADNGNDRGEIVVEGTLPNGDLHAALLIPCDENHLDIEGCDYSLVDSATAALLHSAQTTQAQPANPAKLSPARVTANPRLSFMNRHHRFGALPPK